MTVAEIITEIRKIVNETDTTNTHFTDAEIQSYIQIGQRFVFSKLEQLNVQQTDYTLVGFGTGGFGTNGGPITLSDNFLAIQEAFIRTTDDNKFKRINVVDIHFISEIDPQWPAADFDVPKYVYRRDTFTAGLYPPADLDRVDVLKLFEIQSPADFSSTSEEPVLPRNLQDVLINYGSYMAFLKLQQPDRAGEQLTIANSIIKAHRNMATKFGSNRYGWLWTDGV